MTTKDTKLSMTVQVSSSSFVDVQHKSELPTAKLIELAQPSVQEEIEQKCQDIDSLVDQEHGPRLHEVVRVGVDCEGVDAVGDSSHARSAHHKP